MSPLYIALERLRKERGMTQQQLSDAAGVPQSRISEMERGETKQVSLDVLERLAKALKLEDPGELLRVGALVRHDGRTFLVDQVEDPPGVATGGNRTRDKRIYWRVTTDGFASWRGPLATNRVAPEFYDELVARAWPKIMGAVLHLVGKWARFASDTDPGAGWYLITAVTGDGRVGLNTLSGRFDPSELLIEDEPPARRR